MEAGKKQLILTGALVVALGVVGEVVLRIAGIQYDVSLYANDPQRGWSLRPGAEGFVVREAKQYVRINRGGFRDRERTLEKPPHTIRIAVLGNSWTEALQVPLESTFCGVAERELSRCAAAAGNKVEVLNFGTSGYSGAQELLTLRMQASKYHPDLIVLAIYTARDILNNIRAYNNAADPEQSPYFLYTNGRLALDDSFNKLPSLQPMQIRFQNVRDTVSDRLYLFRAATAVINRAREHAAKDVLAGKAAESGVENLENAIYYAPSKPAIEQAWRVTEELVIATRDEAKALGARFRIVTLANRPQVQPDPDKRREFMHRLGVEDLDYADRRIKALADRERIPITILAKPLSNYAETHRVYLNGFEGTLGQGHWNELGHRLAGEQIATDLSGEVCRDTPAITSIAAQAR